MSLGFYFQTALRVRVRGVVRGRTWDWTDMGLDGHGIGRIWDPFWDRRDLPWDSSWER